MKEVYDKLQANEDYMERCITLLQKYYEDYHMEYDIALKRRSAILPKRSSNTVKEDLVEEKRKEQ